MFFVIEYNRPEGRIVSFNSSPEITEANALRLDLELSLYRRHIYDREVVILDAENEAAIRKTHGRYFKTVREIIAEAK